MLHVYTMYMSGVYVCGIHERAYVHESVCGDMFSPTLPIGVCGGVYETYM